MNTHTGKTQENTSKAVANNLKKQQVSGEAFQFVDNRMETIAQRKLQAVMNDGMGQNTAPGSSGLIQRKCAGTEITHTVGTINVDGEERTAGKAMTAVLDPTQPVKGSATGVNSDWMKSIRADYPTANVVRGHLLNHDLGGFGIEENLYPISTLANADHSSRVEQNVKGALSWADKGDDRHVEYNVTVKEINSYENAKFDCNWASYDALNTKVSGDKQVIDSNLKKDKGGFGGGKKGQHSPTDWQHGTSKGGTEVGKVRDRLDQAMTKRRVFFQDAHVKDLGGYGEEDSQDEIEFLYDLVESQGLDEAHDILIQERRDSEGEKAQVLDKIAGILQVEIDNQRNEAFADLLKLGVGLTIYGLILLLL